MSFININKKQHVVILGDSITFIGHYITYMKEYLDENYPNNEISFVNLGVSGETLSGLCEANRPTPRGCLFDRIDSILPQLEKADLFIFFYGMNDGIYEPYSTEHMKAFKVGVQKLCDILKNHNKPIIALTPPPFDETSYFYTQSQLPPPDPNEPIYPIADSGYDDVLQKYSKWLISQKQVLLDMVVDMHSPLKLHINEKRQVDNNYLYGDGIHPGTDGHYIIAKHLLKAILGDELPK